MIQRFNTQSPWSTGTLEIIAQFVPGRLLFLEQSDLDLNHSDWQQQCVNIASRVTQDNIQTILIDATMNPESLHQIHNTAKPSRLQILNELSQICKCYYITSDYNYYYQPDPRIKFFPAFLWTLSKGQVDEYFKDSSNRKHKTVYDTQLTKSKGIMCLNRNLTWHRMYLLMLLTEKNWFDKISYSFLNNIDHRTDAIAVKQYLTESEIDKIKSLDSMLPIKCGSEMHLEKNKIPIMWTEGASTVSTQEYRDCAISLVTETSLTEGVILTEKTCKPFMAYQIPIMVGPVGANKFLQDMGLDMFEDYIPWKSWDSETDHKLKMQKIVLFLDQLMSKDTAEQDILTAHKNFYPRLIHNKERFHSKEFQNLLTHQISTLS
jgi:hypothetical protein